MIENQSIAQQLLFQKLSAGDFLTQVASWWIKTHSGPTQSNGQQPQASAQDNGPKLQAVAPVVNHGHDQVINKDAGVESANHSQSHLLTARSSMIVGESNTMNTMNGEPMKNDDISGDQSSHTIEPREQNVSSEDSTEDIQERGPIDPLSEVTQHSVVPTVLIASKPDANELEQIADNQPIRQVALNNFVEATTDSNVKVDKSDSSLPSTSSSSDEVTSKTSSSKRNILQSIQRIFRT